MGEGLLGAALGPEATGSSGAPDVSVKSPSAPGLWAWTGCPLTRWAAAWADRQPGSRTTLNRTVIRSCRDGRVGGCALRGARSQLPMMASLTHFPLTPCPLTHPSGRAAPGQQHRARRPLCARTRALANLGMSRTSPWSCLSLLEVLTHFPLPRLSHCLARGRVAKVMISFLTFRGTARRTRTVRSAEVGRAQRRVATSLRSGRSRSKEALSAKAADLYVGRASVCACWADAAWLRWSLELRPNALSMALAAVSCRVVRWCVPGLVAARSAVSTCVRDHVCRRVYT